MYYFIPSWYDAAGGWKKEAPVWYRVAETMTFDDTISQLKMFRHGGQATSLILLNYQPQLRAFLYEQQLSDVPVWSFFDQIQNIKLTQAKPINFKDLNWPKGVAFAYTPFMVIVRLKGQVVAQVQFAENGYLLYIDWLESDVLARRYYLDDRGFVSSILYFEDGTPHHHDFLNQNGVWQVRENYAADHPWLVVNPQADRLFAAAQYETWEDLIAEYLATFKTVEVKPTDHLIISASQQHNQLLIDNFPEQKKIFSFFGQRYPIAKAADLQALAQSARLWVVDSAETEIQLLREISRLNLPQPPLSRLSPFDTRLRLGHSQTIKSLIVYFIVDGLDEASLMALLPSVLEMMVANPLIVLKLVTYQPNNSLKTLEAKVTRLIEDTYDEEIFFASVRQAGENQLAENRHRSLTRLSFHYLSSENALIQTLDTARVVVDLGDVPHLYTQIASLSAGIPQINRVMTDFVVHRENGWVLSELAQLTEALAYYFDGLANWNQALVSTVKKMGDYTSGRLLRQWQQLLGEDVNGTD